MQLFDRKDVTELTLGEIAPLEALMTPAWPDTWRDLATSHYVTLISAPGSGAVAVESLAHLAVALTMGVAQDLGGTQPYIPVGADVLSSTRACRVIDLLQDGQNYKAAADATGLTVSAVRKIERAWRNEQMASRQGTLPLD
ncbi:MAG: Mor transcription activator family protein [Comamonas sp.]